MLKQTVGLLTFALGVRVSGDGGESWCIKPRSVGAATHIDLVRDQQSVVVKGSKF